MDERTQIAVAAMQALCTRGVNFASHEKEVTWPDMVAEMSFEFADAMLAAKIRVSLPLSPVEFIVKRMLTDEFAPCWQDNCPHADRNECAQYILSEITK